MTPIQRRRLAGGERSTPALSLGLGAAGVKPESLSSSSKSSYPARDRRTSHWNAGRHDFSSAMQFKTHFQWNPPASLTGWASRFRHGPSCLGDLDRTSRFFEWLGLGEHWRYSQPDSDPLNALKLTLATVKAARACRHGWTAWVPMTQ